MKQKLLFAMLCIASVLGLRAQTNLVAGWDGGDDTSSPSNFGWTSSASRTLQPRNNNGGIRMMTTYSGYKLEDGTAYSYSETSDLSSVIFWVRYGTAGESFTYTFQGLEPDAYYDFSALIGWHNNSNAPTLTIKVNDGSSDLATITKTVSAKQTLYSVSARFKTPSTITNTTDIKLVFTCNQTGDCMEAISALNLVSVDVVLKDELGDALTYANKVNNTLNNSTLTSSITAAQDVYDDAAATQAQVNDAETALKSAVAAALGDAAPADMTFVLSNPGFESCTVTTENAAAVANAAPLNIEGDWTQTASAAWSSSAVVTYGGEGQVNGVSAPSADNAGESGNTLGISVGWGGAVTYQSAMIILPAGMYTLCVNGYNANSGATQFTSKFGFISATGDATLSAKTSFTAESWEIDKVTFTLNEPTAGRIQIGGQAVGGGSGDNAKVFFDNITLGYENPLAGAKTVWLEAKANAETAISENAVVTGAELTALNAELAKAEPTTIEGYNEATAALEAATATLIAAKVNYDAIIAEIAYAKTLGVATEDAESALAAADATSEKLIAAAQALKVKEYTEVSAAYPNDVTSLLGTWNKGNYDTTSGQGYIGGESYFDKWNGSAMDLTSSATATLPAGKYVVKVAGRGQTGTTMSLSVKVGEDDAVSTPFLMKGDLGKGIDTAGDTNFSDEGTYSNDNNGRGWEYRYITFTTDGSAEVTVTVNGHLNAGTWQSFYAPVLLCDDATYAPIELEIVKAELQILVDEAPAVNPNIGDAAFQLPAAKVEAYSDVLTAAQAAIDNAEATKAIVEQAKSNLEGAIVAYKALEVNAPADGQLFNVILTSAGWDFDQKAMTYIANGRGDAGLYTIQYQEAANQNLAQAFTFTKVDGNNYKMSQIDADGEVRYMCTGKVYGGNDNQIRTTTNADEAMLVTVVPTATAGVYNLFNVAANTNIGSQDVGVFTVGSHNDFNIVETTKPSVVINTTEAGWGTVMLPFAQALPSGVKAYSCAEVEGTTLTMVEVDALEANKPYIIEGAWNETVTGDAQGTALECIDGLLTGVYADTDAPVGTYVLQNPGTVAFYVVVEEKQPTVKANHAYLKVSVPEVKAYFLGGNADGIRSIDNGQLTMDNEGAIYNLSGQKVNSQFTIHNSQLRKGIYIQNGRKMVVK